jgi:hypothetical protein
MALQVRGTSQSNSVLMGSRWAVALVVVVSLNLGACGFVFPRSVDEGEPLHVAQAFDRAVVANDDGGIRRFATADFDVALETVGRSFAARRRLGDAAGASAGITPFEATVVIDLVGRKETVHLTLVEVGDDVWRVKAYTIDEEGKPLEQYPNGS